MNRRSARPHLVTGFVPCVLALACGCGEVPSEVDSLSQPLNGNIVWATDKVCTEPEKDLIRAGFALAVQQLQTSNDFTVCMRSAIMSENKGITGERIAALLAQDMPTTVGCAALSGVMAHAALSIADERTTFDRTFLASNPQPEQLAALVMHEIAHNKGFNHHDTHQDPSASGRLDYEYTVPQQVRYCSLRASRSVVPRIITTTAQFLDESALPPVGRKDGSPFEDLVCSSTRVAVGYDMRLGPDFVSNLALVCRKPGSSDNQTGWAGANTSGEAKRPMCADGEVLVATAIWEGGPVRGLIWGCRNEADVVAGGENVTWRGYEGRPPGDFDSLSIRQCPPHMAVKAVRGRWNAAPFLEQLQLICQRLDTNRAAVNVPNETKLAMVGTTPSSGKSKNIQKCQSRSALTGLSSNTGPQGLARIGGRCGKIFTRCTGGTCTDHSWDVATGGIETHALVSHGQLTGTSAEEFCGPELVLVGLNVRHGTYVNAVQGLCADARTWSTGSPSIAKTLAWQGNLAGAATQLLCPQGAFLNGWTMETKDGVRSLRPYCRNF
jgi:hypothetical protein